MLCLEAFKDSPDYPAAIAPIRLNGQCSEAKSASGDAKSKAKDAAGKAESEGKG